MKKVRTLAALLCVMMVMSVIPMMVNATATTYDTIGDIVDGSLTVMKNYDMTAISTYEDLKYDNNTVSSQITFDAENGANFNNTGYFKLSVSSGWSPLAAGGVATFTAKTTGAFWAAWLGPDGSKYAAVTIKPDSIAKAGGDATIYNETINPGNDFSDYLLVGDSDTQWSLYMKNAASGNKYILKARGGFSSGTDAKAGLYLGDEGYVKNATVYSVLKVYDSIEDIVKTGVAVQKYYDMTAVSSTDELKSTYGITTASAGIEFDSENGANFLGSKYARLSQGSGWSPVSDGKVAAFTMKVTGGAAWTGWTAPDGNAYGTLLISQDGIVTGDAAAPLSYVNTAYTPGDGWSDYLVVGDSDTQWSLYMKNASTDNKYVLMIQGAYGSTGKGAYGLLLGDYAMVKSATIYNPVVTYGTFDSIEAIAGGAVATTHNFDFGTGFQLTKADVDGFTFSEDALELDTSKDDWRFNMTGSWSPLDSDMDGVADSMAHYRFKINNADTTYYLRMDAPEATNKQAVDITISQAVLADSGFVPGDAWVDYIFKDNGKGGYAIYVKKDNETKWIQYTDTEAYESSSNSAKLGVGGWVAGNVSIDFIKVYSTAGVVAESATKPEAAMVEYVNETFAAIPTYENVTKTENVTADGTLNLTPADGAVEGDTSFVLVNTGIPAGGYAEFKMTGSTNRKVLLNDGLKAISITAGDVSVDATGGNSRFMSDGGNSWRTWRVARDAEGLYSGYTRLEGESAWIKMFEGVEGTKIGHDIGIHFMAMDRDGDEELNGVVKVDDVKVYGPVVDAPVVITDGIGSKIVEDGVTVKYLSDLQAFINAEAGRLLVVSYQGDNLAKVEIVKLEEFEGTKKVIDVKDDGVTRVKVFLWDDFMSLNPSMPAINLVCGQ